MIEDYKLTENLEGEFVGSPIDVLENMKRFNEAHSDVLEDCEECYDVIDWNFADKAVVSVSGGLDSTMLVMNLLANGIKHIRTLSFDYGQNHKVEIKKLKKNIKFLTEKGFDITHEIIDVKQIFAGGTCSLTGNSEVPEGHYADETMKSTVVPNRNIIFSAIAFTKAMNWSTETNSNVIIATGIHQGDHTIYPDCRPESQNLAKKLYKISNWGSEKIDYIAPFVNISKGNVLVTGLSSMETLGFTKSEIKKVLKNTHSCYKPNENGDSCGKCGTCVERLEAFEYAKNYKEGNKKPFKWLKSDPIKYFG